MSYQTGTATSYTNLLDLLDTFLTSQGMTLTPAYTGTGNGTIAGVIGGSASVAETITIAMTSATAFTVTGSVSGALAGGTVGTAYTGTKINFTITAGGTAFIAGDQFVVATTPPWTSKRRTAGTEMIWQAPGNGGLDAILVGASIFSNVGADYYNWRLGSFTAYNSGLPFNQQPGYNGGPSQSVGSPVLALWNSTITYWFIANGRRVIVVAKVSTVYVAAYLGFLSSYMAPGAYPAPNVVGGSLAFATEPAASSTTWRWSYAGIEARNFAIPYGASISSDSQSSLVLRLPTGIWRGFDCNYQDSTFGTVWPYEFVAAANYMSGWKPNLDGSYCVFPIVLHDSTPNVYGELDGVVATTGFGNGAENTITVGQSLYLVVPNVFRSGIQDYFAAKLT